MPSPSHVDLTGSSKAELQRRLKRLEANLAQWPEQDADPERAELLHKIAEVKRHMSGAKPVGATLDAARAAAQRAASRLDEVEKAVKAAQLIREAATRELATLTQEVAELESQVTSQQDTFSGQLQMAAMVCELKADKFVRPGDNPAAP